MAHIDVHSNDTLIYFRVEPLVCNLNDASTTNQLEQAPNHALIGW